MRYLPLLVGVLGVVGVLGSAGPAHGLDKRATLKTARLRGYFNSHLVGPAFGRRAVSRFQKVLEKAIENAPNATLVQLDKILKSESGSHLSRISESWLFRRRTQKFTIIGDGWAADVKTAARIPSITIREATEKDAINAVVLHKTLKRRARLRHLRNTASVLAAGSISAAAALLLN